MIGNAIIKNPFSCKLLHFLIIFAKLPKITSYFSSHCKAKLENITSKLLSLKYGIHYACVENSEPNFVSLQQDILNHYKIKKEIL